MVEHAMYINGGEALKAIGYTDEGNVLVVCGREEMSLFETLNDASKGRPMSAFMKQSLRDFDQNMEGAFAAIIEWVQVKDKANALKIMAQDIEAAMKP